MTSIWKAQIFAIGMFATTGEVAMAGPSAVSACLRNVTLLPHIVHYVAKTKARAILAKAGVDLKWRGSRDLGCDIVIDVVATADAEATDHSLARTFPDNGRTLPLRIRVFRDRILQIGNGEHLWVGSILGHVIAHELGHTIARSETHEPTGLMKARWSSADFAEMKHAEFLFSAEYSRAMHNRLGRPQY